MKIALVCKHYTLAKGGLERYTVTLSRTLRQNGHEVHIFAHQWKKEPGLIFHHVPMIPRSSPGKNLSFAWFAARAVGRERFDVVQSMERIWTQDIFRASDGINPVQMRERYPNPMVRKFNAVGLRRQVLTLLENRIFRNGGCRFVITNSKLVRNQIVRHYPVNPEKITVIYNSVDTDRFHPGVRASYRSIIRKFHGIRDDELLLLFVGNNFKLKGLQLILEAVAVLKNPKIRLMVVGNDNAKPYKKWAAANGLGQQALFLGPQQNIEQFYGACDLFLLPTRYDAFANVCLEAMACGAPVITSRTNGASEIVENGISGYVLQTRHVGELADRVIALTEPDQRADMGQRAAAIACTFTRERYMSELMALYQRVLREKAER